MKNADLGKGIFTKKKSDLIKFVKYHKIDEFFNESHPRLLSITTFTSTQVSTEEFDQLIYSLSDMTESSNLKMPHGFADHLKVVNSVLRTAVGAA